MIKSDSGGRGTGKSTGDVSSSEVKRKQRVQQCKQGFVRLRSAKEKGMGVREQS